MKQVIKSILLTSLMSMVGVNTYAFDVAAENSDGTTIYYRYINNRNELEVTNKKYGEVSYSGNVVIPEEVIDKGVAKKVTAIGSTAFFQCEGLTSVTIPNSVVSIGNYSFCQCTALTSITIPNSVISIGEYSFCQCTALQSIMIPNSVVSIGEHSFRDCTILESAVIPEGITVIENSLFQNCKNLKTIDIPSSVETIGQLAFASCNSLSSISFSNNLTYIGVMAFESCNSLNKITFSNNDELTIRGNAFRGCTELQSVYVPNIESWLKINFTGENANPLSYAKKLFVNNEEIKNVVIPEGVVSIGDYAFASFIGLLSINMPNSLSKIGNSAFQYCTSLTNIIIPERVDSIGEQAFAGCVSLTHLKLLPTTPPIIFNNTFTINSIKSINVPKGCKEIYKEAQYWSSFKDKIHYDIYKLVYIIDSDEYKSYEIEEGESITPEPSPSKEGYTFSGWSNIPETMPSNDVTITGSFTVNSYKLTYMIDDNVYKETVYEYGSTITPEPNPSKEGYTFSGWSNIPETMPSNDVTITGSFTVNSYKLTYMIDDNVYKETVYEYGSTITPEPQPEGDYTMFEWLDLPKTMPAHDVVVYANYTSGIRDILMSTQYDVRVYSIDGKQLKELQKGINIIHLGNGKKKKIIVK